MKSELQRLWHEPSVVVSVVVGTVSVVSKNLGQHREQININNLSISQIQTAALLGLARILRRYVTTT